MLMKKDIKMSFQLSFFFISVLLRLLLELVGPDRRESRVPSNVHVFQVFGTKGTHRQDESFRRLSQR